LAFEREILGHFYKFCAHLDIVVFHVQKANYSIWTTFIAQYCSSDIKVAMWALI